MDNLMFAQTNSIVSGTYNNRKECEEITQYVLQQNILRTPVNQITIDYSQDDYRNMIITRPTTISSNNKSKEKKLSQKLSKII